MLRFSAAGRLAGAVLFGALLMPISAHAASFTINSGATAGRQYLTSPGDVGTVQEGGAVVSAGSDLSWSAIQSSASGTTVNNYGTVEADGGYLAGIYGTGGNFVVNNAGSISGVGNNLAGIETFLSQYTRITNTGSITETGISSWGILSQGADATITNRGTITLTGDVNNGSDNSNGIYAYGDRAAVLNTGYIDVTAGTANGVMAYSNDASVTNRGTISVNGKFADGMYVYQSSNVAMLNTGTVIAHATINTGVGMMNAWGSNGTIVNTGTVEADGDFAVGLYSAFSTNTTIINTGTVVANGGSGGAIGVSQFTGGNVTLINSGTIIATASSGGLANALNIWGGGTVTLLAHTVLQGGILFEDPGSIALNIGTGLNTALTFTGGIPLPNTNGQPAVIHGNLLAVADPTGLAGDNSLAFDLSRTITDAVEARMGSPDSAGMTTGALPGSDTTAHRDVWAAGLGFYNHFAAVGSLDSYNTGGAGMLAGADRTLSANSTAGVFGGVTAGTVATGAGSTTISAIGAFAGGYWSHDDGKAFAHVSLVGGGLDNASDRTVANNLVDGGLETARAEYGSFYASPAVVLGLHEHLGDAIVSPSIGLRYAGVYRGGYSETGSAANLSADGGTGQALDVRGAVRTDFGATVSDAGVRRFNVTAGVDGIFTWGGAVDGTLLGTDIALLASSQQSVARGFLGAGTTFDTTDGTHFSADFDASCDTADTFGISAQAGMNKAF
jgi:hypothetical protein